jgi:hypothetical protein
MTVAPELAATPLLNASLQPGNSVSAATAAQSVTDGALRCSCGREVKRKLPSRPDVRVVFVARFMGANALPALPAARRSLIKKGKRQIPRSPRISQERDGDTKAGH